MIPSMQMLLIFYFSMFDAEKMGKTESHLFPHKKEFQCSTLGFLITRVTQIQKN